MCGVGLRTSDFSKVSACPEYLLILDGSCRAQLNYSLTPRIPLNNPYSSPLINLLYKSLLRSLDYSSIQGLGSGWLRDHSSCFWLKVFENSALQNARNPASSDPNSGRSAYTSLSPSAESYKQNTFSLPSETLAPSWDAIQQ